MSARSGVATLEQEAGAQRFAQEMERLRVTMKHARLIDLGPSLWHTLGQMRPEDVAQFEVTSVRRDEC